MSIEQETSAPPSLDLDVQEFDPPSCTFTLDKREWPCRAGVDIPFGAVTRMFLAQRSGDQAAMMTQVGPFFAAVLMPGQYADFKKLIDRDDSPLTLARVELLVQYLAEQVLGFPTEQPGPSSTGLSATGPKSKAGSSSRGTRRKAS